MARETHDTHPELPQGAALVPAMFAANRRDAEKCVELLRESSIAATLGEADAEGRRRGVGVPVLVPEQQLDAATEVLSALDDEEDSLLGASEDDEDEEIDDDDDEMDDDFDDEEYDADDEFWDDDEDDDVDDDEDE